MILYAKRLNDVTFHEKLTSDGQIPAGTGRQLHRVRGQKNKPHQRTAGGNNHCSLPVLLAEAI